MPEPISPSPPLPAIRPATARPAEGSAAASSGGRPAPSPLAAPEGLSRRPPIPDPRSEGPHRQPRASQILSDRNWGGEVSDALKGYLKARTNQAGAFLTHFTESQYARWTGACLGQTHLWMRLNAANPRAAATDRLDALASFEGATHATIHQRAYSDNRREGFTISRMFGIDTWSSKPGTHDAVYNRPMNDLHRIGAHVHSHTGLTLEQLPQALRDIDGYALIELDLPGRRGERHTWGLHKTSDAELTIFDSNYGEFRVPAGELPDFLRHINEQIRADLGGPVVRAAVRPCVVDSRYEDTPAAHLCGWLASSSPGSQQAPAVPEAVMEEARPSALDAAAPLLRRRPTAGSP